MQAELDVQETALRPAPPGREGLGVSAIAQRPPFQRSARVDWVGGEEGEFDGSVFPPTAQQSRIPVQDTPLKPLPSVGEGLGGCCSDQRLPFQPSTSVSDGELGMKPMPTAMHAERDVQATPVRYALPVAPCAPTGL
jgi:hypothetical protein